MLGWSIGATRLDTVVTLPESLLVRAVVVNPARGSLFVAGDQGEGSRILRFTPAGDGWNSVELYATRRRIENLVMGTRPFAGDDGVRYRLFFGARSADGSLSVRTITEGGRLEYQVIGPAATVDSTAFSDYPPERLVAPSGVPTAVHPNGGELYWRDGGGCAHWRSYGMDNWGQDRRLDRIPCRGELRITPNGREYFLWQQGTAGVMLYHVADGAAAGTQAGTQTFLAAPVATPDGRGLAGPVRRGTATALAYAPTTIPLADVANAWALGGTLCDEQLFTRNSGLFRDFAVGPTPQGNQLYAVYERARYDTESDMGNTPALATTDLFLENFGIAFNGVFIVLERKRAMPAFREFVDGAAAELAKTAPNSTWARAFAAVGAFYRGETTGEAGLIATGKGKQPSTVLDSIFNFDELKPRGHYTSDPEMQRYFRAVHYLTEINQVRDPAPLAALPAEIQRKAMRWIDGYRPFIAPSRAPLVWTVGEGRSLAPYARHPWKWSAIFPLSWGIDNEALEASVQHDKWPLDEWIIGEAPPPRQHASGLDVAVMFGDRLARSIHADTLRTYA
ncbi:MAG TPA: DUF3160 domain-containing protein, partial [Gemmatimonadales bacterium]|nr:DUF3160 domain-containing protein [Gemmatimonadales bacterium]